MTQKYPLAWPPGWPRCKNRASGKFGSTENRSIGEGTNTYRGKVDLKMDVAIKRLNYELERLGIDVREDSLISTNLRLNIEGRPRGDQGEPGDPGAAVYFQKKNGPMRVIAIDRYWRVRDNIAAIAATLEAMRAIDRHGGAQILERAFTGFDALPAPKTCWQILGLGAGASEEAIQTAWRMLVHKHHPDKPGGSHDAVAEVNRARDDALAQLRAKR